MIGDLTINAQITFNKQDLPRQQSNTVGELGTPINVSGKFRSDGIDNVTTADAGFPAGAVVTLGWLALKNLGSALIDVAGAPTVTVIGTAGATTYTYVIVSKQADGGYQVKSNTGTTATGNATLSSTNLNRLTWAAVDNAVSYDVYRTVGGATQGKIGNVVAPSATIDDTGLTGDGTTAPTTTPYNFDVLVSLDSGSTFPISLRGGESHAFRAAVPASSIHRKAVANTTRVAFMLCDA